MLLCGVSIVMTRRTMIWKFADVMTLAGATEDQKASRQRETGSAKKKSHNGSHSKRLGSEGARRKASVGRDEHEHEHEHESENGDENGGGAEHEDDRVPCSTVVGVIPKGNAVARSPKG